MQLQPDCTIHTIYEIFENRTYIFLTSLSALQQSSISGSCSVMSRSLLSCPDIASLI